MVIAPALLQLGPYLQIVAQPVYVCACVCMRVCVGGKESTRTKERVRGRENERTHEKESMREREREKVCVPTEEEKDGGNMRQDSIENNRFVYARE